MKHLDNSHALVILIIIIINTVIISFHFTVPFLNDMNMFLTWFEEGKIAFFNPLNRWQYFRPMGLSIMYLLYLFWFVNPIPYHAVTLIFCVINSILLYALSLKIFKNQYLASLTVFIFTIASSLYYQIYFWIPCLFYQLFACFTLSGIYCFVRYHFSEEKKNRWFFLMVAFVSLAILSIEMAVFILPAFFFFELLESESLLDFIKKNLWKYFAFLPVGTLFLLGGLYSLGTTQYSWWYLPIMIPFIIIYLLCFIPVYLILRKKTTMTRFLGMFAYFSAFALTLKFESRVAYFPSMMLSLLVVHLFISRNHENITQWFKHIFSAEYIRKSKNFYAVCPIIALSIVSLTFSGFNYAKMGYTVGLVSDQVILNVDDPDNVSIYILHLPILSEGFLWIIGEATINLAITLKIGRSYNVSLIHVLYPPIDRASELISPAEFNVLSLNSSNLIFECDWNSLLLTNVSGKQFHEL